MKDPFYTMIEFLQSDNFYKLIVTIIGTLVGALTAFQVERDRKRRENVQAALAARAIALNTLNIALVAKSQIAQPLRARYEESWHRLQEGLNRAKMGGPLVAVHAPELYTLTPMTTPIRELSNLLTTKVWGATSSLQTLGELTVAIHDYDQRITDRNALVAEFKTLTDDEKRFAFCWGKPLSDGGSSSRWADNLRKLCEHLDDVIYFSDWISDALTEYALMENRRLWIDRQTILPVAHPDKVKQLLPDVRGYSTYEKDRPRPKADPVSFTRRIVQRFSRHQLPSS